MYSFSAQYLQMLQYWQLLTACVNTPLFLHNEKGVKGNPWFTTLFIALNYFHTGYFLPAFLSVIPNPPSFNSFHVCNNSSPVLPYAFKEKMDRSEPTKKNHLPFKKKKEMAHIILIKGLHAVTFCWPFWWSPQRKRLKPTILSTDSWMNKDYGHARWKCLQSI